ncbi:MAG TPA: FecR family protein [Candidatus Acidoferrum sp.]|nr:FecR family protein [Candidatus Acidoferrum sp.]
MRRLTGSLNKILLTLAVVPVAGLVLAKSELPAASVGEITLVLGKATVMHANGSRVVASVHLPIRVSDVVETEANGHVHIHFVDDELVSVRPSSTLEILRYDYDQQNPQNSAIKLNLVEGTTRAISGEAAKQARQNFRLNTPIAAIGVRGTDFAVNADSRSVRAIVNEGAIVVAPFSSQCSAAALGPCNQNAVELSGLSRQMLQLNTTTAGISSALLPASNAQAQAALADISGKPDAIGKPTKPAENKDLYSETVTSRAVNTTLANNEPVVKTPDPPITVTPTPTPTPTPEFTPTVAQTVEALTSNTQLVWGRWSDVDLSSERITVSANVPITSGMQITVGSETYGLFRSEPAGKSTVQTGLGALAFDLTKAQAFYKSGGTTELMQVNGGQLSIDFNQSQFSTSLQLNQDKTGSFTFSDTGSINSSGYFVSRHDDQSVAGAVSLDGKEAGYLFQKALSGGTVEGLTLWGLKH